MKVRSRGNDEFHCFYSHIWRISISAFSLLLIYPLITNYTWETGTTLFCNLSHITGIFFLSKASIFICVRVTFFQELLSDFIWEKRWKSKGYPTQLKQNIKRCTEKGSTARSLQGAVNYAFNTAPGSVVETIKMLGLKSMGFRNIAYVFRNC